MDNRSITRDGHPPEGLNDERNFSTDSTDSFASDDTDCDADSCDSSEEDF